MGRKLWIVILILISIFLSIKFFAYAQPLVNESISRGPYPLGERYYIRVFNVDDISRVKVNGRDVLEVSYYQEKQIDITGYLREGQNTIELILENTGGGWTYGYELKHGNTIIWQDRCGIVGREGCRNNDQTRGFVARHLINLTLQAPAPASPTSPQPTLPQLQWPLRGSPKNRRIIAKFGDNWPWGYCGGKSKRHAGIDIEAFVVGEDVYAAESGIVKAVYIASDKYNWGWGIVIEHNGFTTVYLHVIPKVSENSRVDKGQPIAKIAKIDGTPHLHFGIRLGKFSEISKRGALPQIRSNEYKCDDPIFPENFIDPMSLQYEEGSTQPLKPIPPSSSPTPQAPKPEIISDLKILELPPYRVGQIITAEFTIRNSGNAPITFDVLTVGGRLNGQCPNNKCPDFTFIQKTLYPNESFTYRGKLKLELPGNYHFFTAYRTKDGQWNTSIPTLPGVRNTFDIFVQTEEYAGSTVPVILPVISEPKNFRKINDKIFAGGRPTIEQIRWLKERVGIKSIINLELWDLKDVKHYEDEAKRLEIEYINCPIDLLKSCPANEVKMAVEYIKFLIKEKKFPIYIHCWGGVDRTGFVIAAYRVMVEGWDVNEAIEKWKEEKTEEGKVIRSKAPFIWGGCFRKNFSIK